MSWYDQCVMSTAKPVIADPELPIWVGIDASVKHDSSAVVATTWDKKSQVVRLIFHRIYQPAPDDPLDFEATIEATVLDLRKRFRVRKVLFDPYQMVASAQRLARQGVKMEEFPQSVPNLTAASQNMFELLQGRTFNSIPMPTSGWRWPRHCHRDRARLAHCQGKAEPQDRRCHCLGDVGVGFRAQPRRKQLRQPISWLVGYAV